MFVDSMTEPSGERKGRPMADSAKEAWNEVGDKFGEWSRLLGERYRKRGEELGSTVEEDRKKLDDAIQTVTRQLDQAFTSFGETLRDAEAKQHLKEATKSLGDALSATFSEVGDQIRSKLGSSGSSGSGSSGSSGSSTQAD
jgi:hypothetical protein